MPWRTLKNIGGIKEHAKNEFFKVHGRILRDDGGVGEHDKGIGKNAKHNRKKSKP
jgi:hypothetical protein